ncbi:hypothetical protein AVEN_189952-1 [Araneus ventricosus]|uniref:Uncharacterized protein n=1 Tax=Araneus ventricosus TaxID=182803 RepID=A0A4Y2F0Z6_ARAVE|nr:hypothetical protein AVEN_189952-1 [Araneus ventricosus]
MVKKRTVLVFHQCCTGAGCCICKLIPLNFRCFLNKFLLLWVYKQKEVSLEMQIVKYQKKGQKRWLTNHISSDYVLQSVQNRCLPEKMHLLRSGLEREVPAYFAMKTREFHELKATVWRVGEIVCVSSRLLNYSSPIRLLR